MKGASTVFDFGEEKHTWIARCDKRQLLPMVYIREEPFNFENVKA